MLNGPVGVSSGGTLGAASFGKLDGTVSVAGGGTLMASTASALGSVILNSGAVFDMTDAAIGTFDLTGHGTPLVLQGATLDFDLTDSGMYGDLLTVDAGAASVSGTNTINITPIGAGLAAGHLYTVISAASGLTGIFQFSNGSSSEDLAAANTHFRLTLANSDTAETVSVALLGNQAIWNSATSGSWDTASNWLGNLAPLAVGDSANFDNSVSPPEGVVTLDTSPIITTLTFANANGVSVARAAANTLAFSGATGGATIASLSGATRSPRRSSWMTACRLT